MIPNANILYKSSSGLYLNCIHSDIYMFLQVTHVDVNRET